MVTRTSTTPAVWAGVVTRSFVDDRTRIDVPRFEPNATRVTCTNRAPMIVTRVAPDVRPEVGETDLTVGAETASAGTAPTNAPATITAARTHPNLMILANMPPSVVLCAYGYHRE